MYENNERYFFSTNIKITGILMGLKLLLRLISLDNVKITLIQPLIKFTVALFDYARLNFKYESYALFISTDESEKSASIVLSEVPVLVRYQYSTVQFTFNWWSSYRGVALGRFEIDRVKFCSGHQRYRTIPYCKKFKFDPYPDPHF